MREDAVKKEKADSKKFFELLDEAYFLVRDHKLEFLPIYLAGSVPFIVGLMLFVYQLGHCRAGDIDIVIWAMVLTALLCWKNLFQCRFNDIMIRTVAGDAPKLSWKQILTGAMRLTIMQSGCLILFTLAIAIPSVLAVFFPFLLLVIPLFCATAGVICATETDCGFRASIFKVLSHLFRRPGHALGGCAVLLMVMVIVILNLVCLSLVIPLLLKIFFNMDTAFSTVSSLDALMGLLFNSTIWSIIFGIAWLLLEPLYSAYCLLRVFYGESRLKGLDLKAQIIRFARKAVLLIVIFLCIPAMSADKPEPVPATQSAKNLEQAIKQTLKSSEFQWRDERVSENVKKDNWLTGYIERAVKYVWKLISDIFLWVKDVINKWFPSTKNSNGGFSWLGLWDAGKYIIITLLLLAGGCFLYKYLRKRSVAESTMNMASLQSIPDLTDENISADLLGQGEWLRLGTGLLEQGECRLALRAFYLGCISALADRHFLNIAIGKSDYEYLFELKRRGHSEPQLISGFSEAIMVFQRVWYGDYPVDTDMAAYLKRQAEAFAEAKKDVSDISGFKESE